MLDIVNVQILWLTSSKQVVSACWVLETLDILRALIVVCRDLAEIASAAMDLWIDDSDQLTRLHIPYVNLPFHCCRRALFLVGVDCDHGDLWTVLKRLDVQFAGKNLMDFEVLVPWTCDQLVACHFYAWNWRCMTSNNLQNVSCLHIPWKNFIRVKRTSKNDILRLINLKTSQLALLVRLELPEFLILNHIVRVDTPIKTAGEKSVFVGELDVSDLRLVLLESSQTESTDLVP